MRFYYQPNDGQDILSPKDWWGKDFFPRVNPTISKESIEILPRFFNLSTIMFRLIILPKYTNDFFLFDETLSSFEMYWSKDNTH